MCSGVAFMPMYIKKSRILHMRKQIWNVSFEIVAICVAAKKVYCPIHQGGHQCTPYLRQTFRTWDNTESFI